MYISCHLEHRGLCGTNTATQEPVAKNPTCNLGKPEGVWVSGNSWDLRCPKIGILPLALVCQHYPVRQVLIGFKACLANCQLTQQEFPFSQSLTSLTSVTFFLCDITRAHHPLCHRFGARNLRERDASDAANLFRLENTSKTQILAEMKVAHLPNCSLWSHVLPDILNEVKRPAPPSGWLPCPFSIANRPAGSFFWKWPC